MPAPVHARIRLGGTLFNDALWSISLNYANSNGMDPFANGSPDVQEALEDWADAVRALNQNKVLPVQLQQMLSQAGHLEYVRTSRIGLDGKESAVALVTLNPVVSGSQSAVHSAQTALAVSLSTGRPGASYRGRVYLPAINVPIENSGRIPTTYCQSTADTMGQFLAQIGAAAGSFNAAVPFDVVPIVASNRQGVSTRVTAVRVGNRFDSQRRRAEAEKELYCVAAVAQ